MSDQGRGYGPVSDAIGTAFWIFAFLCFSWGGFVVALIASFFAGLFFGSN